MLDSQVLHSTTFQGQNLIVACSRKNPRCQTYLQNRDGNFELFQQRENENLSFSHFKASREFLMASHQNRIMIFTDYHLDCYGSFTSDLWTISDLMAYRGPHGEHYLLMLFKTPFKLLIRVVELELGEKYRMARAGGEVLFFQGISKSLKEIVYFSS